MKIIWAPVAEQGLLKTISYLEAEWSVKEILRLEKNIEDLLHKISKHPKICPPAKKNKSLRKGIVDKNNYIIYRVKSKNTLEIVNFRGVKQLPLY